MSPVQSGEVTPLSAGFASPATASPPALPHKLLSYQPVLMVLPRLLAAEGLDDRPWLLPLIR